MQEEEIILEFRNVTDEKRAPFLKNINFYLKEGYIMGLIGPNGAGKTTLFRHLFDHTISYRGDILFQGISVKKDKTAWKEHMAYISEDHTFLKDVTILGNARMFGLFYENWDETIFIQKLSDFHLCPTSKVQSLSRGENMKFQLAFAMAHKPKLYLIDEATAGMDVVFKKEFYRTLRLLTQQNASVLMTTHSESEVKQYADYIVTLQEHTITSIVENIQ